VAHRDRPALAVAWLADLWQWSLDVWTRYQPLPPYWPWHPTVVAEILPVRHLWTAALLPDAPPDLLAAWHDRWRPGAAHRIGRTLAGCERADGAHVDVVGRRWRPDTTRLDDLAHWWATTHGSVPPPGLCPEDRP